MCITHIDGDNCNGKGCYKYGNVEVRAPVLYDDAGGCKVVREDYRVFEKVVPTCGIPGLGQQSLVIGELRELTPRLDRQIELRIQRSLYLRVAWLPSLLLPS